MSNQQTIRAEEATIKTATVEIRVLTISGKQMTLAVFRQLPRVDPVKFWFTMRYDFMKYGLQDIPADCSIWGCVNYHDKFCQEHYQDSPHLHVVWQRGNELRHTTIGEYQCFNWDKGGDFWDFLLSLDQLFIAV